jgi:hypothetical protein
MMNSPYSSVICPDLVPKVRCIKVRKYNHGQGDFYSELFHQHIPERRINNDAAPELLKALVLKFEGDLEAGYILQHYLNSRGKEPESYAYRLQFRVVYPELGVMRKCCGADVEAWIDTVVLPDDFRKVPQA